MGTNFAEILTKLEEEQKRLRGQHETASRTVHHIEAELGKIEQAISVLMGRTPAKGRPGRKKGLKGPEVVSLIERLLHEEGPLEEPQLRTRLGDKASAEGRSKAGLHLVYKKALRNGPFEFNGASWQIRKKRRP